jgi:hypothetical protein
MLLVLGLIIAGVGLVWILAPSIPWLGRLPGDIRIERENFRFYFPLVTCLILSVALSIIVWIVRRFGGEIRLLAGQWQCVPVLARQHSCLT